MCLGLVLDKQKVCSKRVQKNGIEITHFYVLTTVVVEIFLKGNKLMGGGSSQEEVCREGRQAKEV